jgi:hypothetical protein
VALNVDGSDSTQPVILFLVTNSFTDKTRAGAASQWRIRSSDFCLSGVFCSEVNRIKSPGCQQLQGWRGFCFLGQISSLSPHLHPLCSSTDIPSDRHLLRRSPHFLTRNHSKSYCLPSKSFLQAFGSFCSMSPQFRANSV